MEICEKSSNKRKRSFVEAWLTDDRYKSWIRKVSSDETVYYCNACNKTFPCNSHISRHASSVCHRNNIEKESSSDDNLEKKI